MRIIELSNGKIAIIDDDDYEMLSKFNWYAMNGGNNSEEIYAMTTIQMHRMIMGLVPGDERQIDHIDGNPLNNQKSNLRIVNRSQNNANRIMRKRRNKTGYRGVRKTRDKFRAEIRVDNKTISLGSYVNPEDAARAYNRAAAKYFGQHAVINIPGKPGKRARATIPEKFRHLLEEREQPE